jgi:hypothetical protein
MSRQMRNQNSKEHFPFLSFLKENIRSMRSLFDSCFCVSFKLPNQLDVFQEIWYERYAIGGHTNRVQLLITIGRTHGLVRWGKHQRHLIWGHKMMYGNRNSKNVRLPGSFFWKNGKQH